MAEAAPAAAEASPDFAFDDWSSSDEVAEEFTNKEDLGPAKEVAILQMALAAVAGSLERGGATATEGGPPELGEEFLRAVRALRDSCSALLELGERTRCGQEKSETSSTGANTEEDFSLSAEEDELSFTPRSRSSAMAREAAAAEEVAGPLAKGGAPQPAAAFATVAPKTSSPATLVVPALDLARFTGTGAAVGAQQDEAESFQFSFCVSCACTRMGQQVRIVGSCAALGAWDPLAGLPLYTSAAEFPIWRGRCAVTLEAEAAVEYKYVICDSECNSVQWEEMGNRRLHVASAAALAGSRSSRDGGGKELAPPRVLVAEAFNELGEPAARFRNASLPGLGLYAALCTPRRPLQAAPVFAPTMRRHLPVALLAEAEAPPGAAGSEAAPSILVLPPAALAAAAAAPRLAREDSFSQLFARPAEEPTGAPGQDFQDSYELLGDGPLAEGTFGLVWRCRPRAAMQQEEWAAKILHTRPGAEPRRNVLSPLEEVRLHSSLRHPHVVFLLEYFADAGAVTAVLEYCRGGDLFDAIQAEASRPGGSGGGLGEPGAAAMAGHILAALGYLHGRSIVHRDLKCENVLLARSGVPHAENSFKLGDFGFAAVDSGLGLCEQLGSPDTVAPEVVLGKTYSCPADLWSMGVVLYMALAAESPFCARTDGKVLQRVVRGEYSLCGGIWDVISEPAKDLVAALLTLQPLLRLPAARALGCAWLR